MKVLKVLCGLPRSGKTTVARKWPYPIVNPDSVRLAIHGERFIGLAEPWVWAMTFAMVDALFRAGHDVVTIDATNVTGKRRMAWCERFKAPEYRIEFEVIDTPPAECIRRARAMGDEEIVPVIERMAKEWDMKRPIHWDEP
jgi:predicted kinase